jgi:hypothetical protein
MPLSIFFYSSTILDNYLGTGKCLIVYYKDYHLAKLIISLLKENISVWMLTSDL